MKTRKRDFFWSLFSEDSRVGRGHLQGPFLERWLHGLYSRCFRREETHLGLCQHCSEPSTPHWGRRHVQSKAGWGWRVFLDVSVTLVSDIHRPWYQWKKKGSHVKDAYFAKDFTQRYQTSLEGTIPIQFPAKKRDSLGDHWQSFLFHSSWTGWGHLWTETGNTYIV